MPFQIEVATNAADQVGDVRRLTSELGATETAGVKAGKSISDQLLAAGTNAARAAAAAAQLKAALSGGLGNAAESFRGVTNELARQAEILSSLRGPSADYASYLRSADKLLDDSKISVDEYTESVTRLNKAYGDGAKAGDDFNRKAFNAANTNKALSTISLPSAKGGASEGVAAEAGSFGKEGLEALGGQFGEVGEAAAQFATKGALAAAAVVGVGVAAVESYDKYVELKNSVIELTDASHDQNTVLSEQMEIAEHLHSNLADTIALTKQLSDVTREAGEGRMQLAQDEELLGKFLVTSGKPLAEGGTLMKELMDASQGTTTRVQSLLAVFEQYPNVLQALEGGLGKTRGELINMAEDGKFSLDAVRKALQDSDTATAQWAQRTETLGEKWSNVKDSINIGVGSAIDGMGAIQKQQVDALTATANAVTTQIFGEDVTKSLNAPSADAIQDTAKGWIVVAEKAHAYWQELKNLKDATDNVTRGTLGPWVQKIGADVQTLSEALVPLKTRMEQALGDKSIGLGSAASVLAPQIAAAKELAGLQSASSGGLLGGSNGLAVMQKEAELYQQINGYADQYFALLQRTTFAENDNVRAAEALSTAWSHGAISLSQFSDEVDHLKGSQDAMNVLFRSGTITLTEYLSQFQALTGVADKYTARSGAFAKDGSRTTDPDKIAYVIAESVNTEMNRDVDQLQANITSHQKQIAQVLGEANLQKEQEQFQQQMTAARQEAAAYAQGRVSNPLDTGPYSLGGDSGGNEEAWKKFNDQLDRQGALLSNTYTPAERYRTALNEINLAWPEGERNGEEYGRVLQDLKDRWVAITPQQQYNKEIRNTAELMAQGAMDAKQYAIALQQIADKYGVDRGAVAGFTDGLNAIKTSLGTSNGAIRDAMTGTFGDINNFIVATAQSGTAAWGAFFTSLEKDADQLALKLLEQKLFSVIPGLNGVTANSNQGAAAATAVSTALTSGGATAGTSIAASMVSAGITAGEEMAAAIASAAAGTAASSASAGGLAGLLNGFAGSTASGAADVTGDGTLGGLQDAFASAAARMGGSSGFASAASGAAATSARGGQRTFALDRAGVAAAFSSREGQQVLTRMIRLNPSLLRVAK